MKPSKASKTIDDAKTRNISAYALQPDENPLDRAKPSQSPRFRQIGNLIVGRAHNKPSLAITAWECLKIVRSNGPLTVTSLLAIF